VVTQAEADQVRLLWLPLYLIVPALVAVMAAEGRARAVTGPAIAAERPGLVLRRVLVAGTQAALLAVLLLRGDLPQDLVAECLMLGILLAWITPGSQDAVLGELGVRRGWSARRYEDLEEWRLTGEHLRFRLAGEWTSVPCPPPQQPRVRGMLVESNAAAESRFPE
jgi:hypothetical protein